MNNNNKFYIFLIFWTILNIFTAVTTELYSDEAYYWMYSKFLDFGYFDHPPMIALLIKMGSIFGKNEFGVRIFNILLMSSGIYLMYKIIKPKNIIPFCLTLFCFLILHFISFIALPDGALFFFNVLFIYVFNEFLKNNTLSNQILVGIVAALMMYSKYHGGIIILFCIASHPKILLNRGIYISGIIAVTLFLPHLFWQYTNDFPSITYHMISRASKSYRLTHTLDYVTGNIPFHGGLISIILFLFTFYYKTNDPLDKIMKWNLYGTFIFFFLITFKGQFIEANWTLPATFPLIYLGYKQAEKSAKFHLYKKTLFFFIPIMIFLRIHISFLPVNLGKKDRALDLHKGKQFALKVNQTAKEKFIVANKYQDASFLNFYLDKNYLIPSINISSRSNQYAIWKFENRLNCPDNIAFVGHLNGEKVTSQNLSRNVSLIENVSLPSCLDLNFKKIKFEGKITKLFFSSEKKLEEIRKFQDEYYFEILEDDKSTITIRLEKLQQENNKHLSIILNSENITDNSRIRFSSKKLGTIYSYKIK